MQPEACSPTHAARGMQPEARSPTHAARRMQPDACGPRHAPIVIQVLKHVPLMPILAQSQRRNPTQKRRKRQIQMAATIGLPRRIEMHFVF